MLRMNLQEEAREVDMVATATAVKEVMAVDKATVIKEVTVAAREAMAAKEVMGVVMVKTHTEVKAKVGASCIYLLYVCIDLFILCC